MTRHRTAKRRALVIVNPVAGRSGEPAVGERLGDGLRERGIDCEARETRGDGDAESWARAAAGQGFDLVVAAGGDGTVAEAAGGLARASRQVPLGILPTGTANVLAATLDLPTDLGGALDVIADGRQLAFDVGRLPGSDRHFLLTVAIGLPGRIIEDAPRELKRRFGFGAYLVAAIRNLVRLRRTGVRIELDGSSLDCRAHTVLIMNAANIQAFGMDLAAGVSPHDGKLDVVVGRSASVSAMAAAAFDVLRGTRMRRVLEHRQAERVQVAASSPLSVQADGEPLGTTPVDVEILPARIEIYVPASYEPSA